jgi:hypothetical protein
MHMNTPISPWTDQAERTSPDGRYQAIFDKGMEVAMGAPTLGRLRVIRLDEPKGEFLITDDAAASMVWSDDSQFLAFAKWRMNKKQSLCVLRVSNMNIDESPDEFRVLELRSFSGGRIKGIDSPVYQPRTFALKYIGEP